MVATEWQSINIGIDTTLKARIGWQGLTVNEYRDNGNYYLVTGTDFDKGLVNWNTCHYVDKYRYTQDRNIQLRNGDILITKDGTIGKVGYVENLTLPATLNSGVFVVRPKHEEIFSKYLYYIFTSEIFDDFLTKLVAGSTINHLYQKDFVNFEFQIPPKQEQQAIATALSDTDALIQALEKLIAKKEAIKTGTMQELLTGKKRLDGEYIVSEKYKQTEIGLIPEDWEIKTFQKVFSFLTTATYSRAELSNNGDIQYLHYGDIHTKYNFTLNFLDAVLPTISADKLKKYPLLKDGDIVMADASEDYQGICKSIEIKNLNKKKVIAGLHTFLLRDKHNIFINGFRGYLMASSLLKNQFDRLATGMKVYGVSKGNLLKIQIPIPPKLEQQLITTTLLDMDKEIEALKSKLSKVKVIKEGMMQELLTGKTRLLKEVS